MKKEKVEKPNESIEVPDGLDLPAVKMEEDAHENSENGQVAIKLEEPAAPEYDTMETTPVKSEFFEASDHSQSDECKSVRKKAKVMLPTSPRGLRTLLPGYYLYFLL